MARAGCKDAKATRQQPNAGSKPPYQGLRATSVGAVIGREESGAVYQG